MLKEKLLEIGLIDNIYLDAYIELICNNLLTKKIKYQTQQHHIIPKCYFNINNLIIDNSSENIVNLLYKDHLLAHYYLCLCSSGKFKAANEYSMIIIFNTKVKDNEPNFICNLDKFQQLYEENMLNLSQSCSNRFKNIKQSDEHIQKRVNKNTGKKRTQETKNKMSLSQKCKPKSAQAKKHMSEAQRLYAQNETDEHKLIRIEKQKQTMLNKSDEWKKQYSEKLSKAIKGRIPSEEEKKHHSESLKGKQKSSEHRSKISQAAKNTVHIYKDDIHKRVKLDVLEDYLNDGWELGGSSTTKGRKWYNNGIIEKMFKIDSVPVDFVEGRLKNNKG